MKLYDGGLAPNPRRVRIFLAEKSVKVPLVPIDMDDMGHRSVEITSRNPLQRLPVLELDDGTILTESVAICRYFEGLYPEPPLMGVDNLDRAVVEMWSRRMELSLLFPVGHAFRHLHPAMIEWEVPQVPEWGEANKPKVIEVLKWLDDELAEREFIAGVRFTIADITAMIAIDFRKPARITLPEECMNVQRWYANMRARPSARA
jgi:glutathione S-transferase